MQSLNRHYASLLIIAKILLPLRTLRALDGDANSDPSGQTGFGSMRNLQSSVTTNPVTRQTWRIGDAQVCVVTNPSGAAHDRRAWDGMPTKVGWWLELKRHIDVGREQL